MRLSHLTIVILAFCTSTPIANCDEINFEVSSMATGSLGGVQFNDQLVTISGVGDTENVETNGSINFLLEDIFVTVEIDGLGSAVFTDAIQAVSNNNSELGGFGNTTSDTGLFFVFNSVFSTYDLRSEIGPVSGTTFVNNASHATSAGNLFFVSSSNVGTFEARFTAIPEPNTAISAVLFVCALTCRRRRR